jgi:polar amino acid transport system substrate-binding protein
MRKITLGVVSLAVLAAACSNNTDNGGSATPTGGATSAAPIDAKSCAQGSDILYITDGELTIGTDNPAFQPWFAGTGNYGPWKANPSFGVGNPASDEGFESAFAYDLADQLGFTQDQVTWVPVNFNESFKPGQKSFDLDINEISYNPDRATVVSFSDSYYDVSQALIVKKDGPFANATTFADLKDANLGVQVGTTSYNYIVDNIQPSQKPQVYDKSVDVVAAFNNGQIDGWVTDAPTAYVSVLLGSSKDAVVAGQFPQIGDQEYFGTVSQLDSPLVACVNQAIAVLQEDGTLAALQKKWLKDVTYPEIQQ